LGERSTFKDRSSGLVGALHERIFARRTRILTGHLALLIPSHASILDVGCGDGTIDNLIMARRSDVKIEGIDPLVRPNAQIPSVVLTA
jgi:2-polyprenyl-3-methyl-5-hydroxy-6-metoxy-1,4-benzoquinol methylase